MTRADLRGRWLEPCSGPGMYGLALALVLLCLGLRALAFPAMGDGTPFVLLVPPVLIASLFGGFGPGAFATVACLGGHILLSQAGSGASGAGAESRRSIGYVIVGGITFGTLLTLFVVPTVYLLIASWREKRLAAKAAAAQAPAE